MKIAGRGLQSAGNAEISPPPTGDTSPLRSPQPGYSRRGGSRYNAGIQCSELMPRSHSRPCKRLEAEGFHLAPPGY